MKILMLGWELPPHNSGGLGVASYQLCKALASQGADIDFILPYESTTPVPFMKVIAAHHQDASVVRLAGTAYSSDQYTFVNGHEDRPDLFSQQQLYEGAVERLVESQTFDIIHAHDWLTFRAGLRVKHRTGWPLIVHVHSVEADRAGHAGGGNPLVREIEALGLLMADRIVAVSEHTKRAIVKEYAIPPEKIVVIYNGLDRTELEPLDPDNAYRYVSALRASGWHIVTSVGRLTVQKGLPNLLRAIRSVIDRMPKTLLLVVGSGEQYYELIELAAELGILANVAFTGFQRGKAWRDAFASADLFVLPSVSEPFGLTPLEALHYGAPSLVSRQSGVSEVLKNCLKVDFWDINEMANQITGALENRALHDVLLSNALSELDHLSWDNPAANLLNIYEAHTTGGTV